MPKFKIGEKVIHIISKDEHVIDGFNCCKGCGKPCVYLKGVETWGRVWCNSDYGFKGCGHKGGKGERLFYSEELFEKPISLGETTEYKLKVSIPELVEIKEYQNQ